MLATLVIFLREGVEASMIVAILLAYLNRLGKREHFRDVFIGVGAALLLATAAGAVSGAAIGLAGSLVIAFVIYRLGHKLNLGKFFTVIGVLLMVFAAGLLADAVENLQQLGWLPVLDQTMWHSGRLLSESSALGDVAHTFLGYSDAPTPLQLLVYLGYLAIVVTAYLGLRALPRSRRGATQAVSEASSPSPASLPG